MQRFIFILFNNIRHLTANGQRLFGIIKLIKDKGYIQNDTNGTNIKLIRGLIKLIS